MPILNEILSLMHIRKIIVSGVYWQMSMLPNNISKGGEEEEELDSNLSDLPVVLTKFSKVRKIYDAIHFRYLIL